jgi:hypothetical protein
MGTAGGITFLDYRLGDKAGCPLISNTDGQRTSLGTILEAMQSDLAARSEISNVVDLSGAAVVDVVWVADAAYTLQAYLVYTEASSADAGINVKVGKMIVGTDDDDFFVVAVATEVSKETGYRKALTMASTAVAAGDVIIFTSAGSKAGTGNVVLQLVLTRT